MERDLWKTRQNFFLFFSIYFLQYFEVNGVRRKEELEKIKKLDAVVGNNVAVLLINLLKP